ncbi:MAG: glycosyltransferase family 2 protein [Muribaculaceae bacterium]|nr:glycosyltransferase family 2 protein [Muribaculaceae bacterium]
MIRLSIIIPIYNVPDYLRECLNSVYSQAKDNWEIILVNDGSTDNSGDICDEYKKKYSNTIVIHKENGGLSDARNAGIEIAKGEYIYFLDSDDWLAPNAIQTLLDFAIKNNCEIVQGGFYYAYNGYLLFDNRRIDIDQTPFVLNREEVMVELIKNEYVKNFAWGKLYKTSIVKKYLFQKGKFFEDSYWQHLIVNETANYGVIPTPLYYYRQRESSISGQFSIKLLDLLKGYEERLNFISNYYPRLTNLMAKQLWNISANMLLASKKSDTYAHYNEFWQYINREYSDVFNNAFKANVKYHLGRQFTTILELYNFINRIKNRLFAKDLLKIHIDDKSNN